MRKQNKYYSKTERELNELLQSVEDGKDARDFHQALKKLDRKNGLPMRRRYPWLPVQVSAVAIIFQIAALIFAILWR